MRPIAWTVLVSLLAFAGCESETPPDEEEVAEEESEAAEVSLVDFEREEHGTASIRGRVAYEGHDPGPRPMADLNGHTGCSALHAGPVQRDPIEVSDEGGLKDAFVWVREGAVERFRFPVPEGDPPVLDQRGCRYEPRVWGIRAGRTFIVRNSDPVTHNVHGATEGPNREFNFSQSTRGAERVERLLAPQIMVQIGCDVHSWMRSNVGVVDHPYFAVTGDDGSFEFANLPPGRHVIAVWHEFGRLDRTEVEVEVDEGETLDEMEIVMRPGER